MISLRTRRRSSMNNTAGKAGGLLGQQLIDGNRRRSYRRELYNDRLDWKNHDWLMFGLSAKNAIILMPFSSGTPFLKEPS